MTQDTGFLFWDFAGDCLKPFVLYTESEHDPDFRPVAYVLGCGKYQDYHQEDGRYCQECYEMSRAKKESRERQACQCIIQEAWEQEDTVWFITLTHSDQWKIEDGKRVRYTLSDDQILKHAQDMIKVLRKFTSFQYRIYPEYGAENGRFHLHIIAWGFPPGGTFFFRWKREWIKRIPNTTQFDFQKISDQRKMWEYLTKYITKQNVKGRIRCSQKPHGMTLIKLKEKWRKLWLNMEDHEKGVKEWALIAPGFRVSQSGLAVQVDPSISVKLRVESKRRLLSIHSSERLRISLSNDSEEEKECLVKNDLPNPDPSEGICWYPTQKILSAMKLAVGASNCSGLMRSVQEKRYKVLAAMLSLPQLRRILLSRRGQFISLAYFWSRWRLYQNRLNKFG